MNDLARSMVLRLTAGVAIAALASTAVAVARGPSVSVGIHGPTSIKSGQKFNLTITGHVSTVHLALRTEMVEQTPAGPPCATSLDAEENMSQRPYAHAQGGEFIMHKSFSEVFHYAARSPVATHRFCAYVSRFIYPNHQLLNRTFAHASLTVTYHP